MIRILKSFLPKKFKPQLWGMIRHIHHGFQVGESGEVVGEMAKAWCGIPVGVKVTVVVIMMVVVTMMVVVVMVVIVMVMMMIMEVMVIDYRNLGAR